MPKFVQSTELDFETGTVVETLAQKASCVSQNLRVIKNPYTGNKRKLIPYLFRFIENKGYSCNSFTDLFAGSGFVSVAAKYCGSKKVTCNDIMQFSFLNSKFLLDNQGTRLNKETLVSLFLEGPDSYGIVQSKYSSRFTPEEAKLLDKARFNIESLAEPAKTEALVTVLHFVMNFCFVGGRLNKGQVLSELEHRLSHVRNGGKPLDFKGIEPYGVFSWDKVSCVSDVHNKDVFEFLTKSDCASDLCYIDPPYGGQQSNYSFMYSFFEDYIANKEIDCQSNERTAFSKTNGYSESFKNLLDNLKTFPVLIFSFNDSSWCKIDEIVEHIKLFRRKVAVEEVSYDYLYRGDSSSKEFIIAAE